MNDELRISDADMFATVVKQIRKKEIGTDDAIEALDQAGYFGEPFEAKALRHAKRVHVRRMFRKIKDQDGWPIWFNLKKTTAKGTVVNFYKQISLFTKTEYEYIATEFHERGQRYLELRDHVLDTARQRGIQLDLPFME